MQYKDYITDVPNWPAEGIVFRDITPLLSDQVTFNYVVDELIDFINDEFDCNLIAGIESRGFIFGSAVASISGMGFVPVRKEGKLPPPVKRIESTKEYGVDILEVKENRKVLEDILIIDDVLATGGTLLATEKLLNDAGYNVIGALVVVDLKYLHSDILIGGKPVKSIISYYE